MNWIVFALVASLVLNVVFVYLAVLYWRIGKQQCISKYVALSIILKLIRTKKVSYTAVNKIIESMEKIYFGYPEHIKEGIESGLEDENVIKMIDSL